MKNLREFVADLSETECRQIHAEFCELERSGQIGDCALRDTARAWVDQRGIGEASIVLWMERLAFEVWRRFAVDRLEGV